MRPTSRAAAAANGRATLIGFVLLAWVGVGASAIAIHWSSLPPVTLPGFVATDRTQSSTTTPGTPSVTASNHPFEIIRFQMLADDVAHGRPAFARRQFDAFSPFGYYLEYADADNDLLHIEVLTTGGQLAGRCSDMILSGSGSHYCAFNGLEAGDYNIRILVDGQETALLSVTITEPVEARAPQGFIDASIGNTLSITGADGVEDIYNFQNDGTYLLLHQGARYSGQWSRGDNQVCLYPNGGNPNGRTVFCLDDRTSHGLGERWTSLNRDGRLISYEIRPGIAVPTQSASLYVETPSWIERPSNADMARFYPDRAARNGQAGRVVLDCVIDDHGRPSCQVVSEDPPGLGFGSASLRVAQRFRMSPRLEDGALSQGARVRIPVVWRMQN